MTRRSEVVQFRVSREEREAMDALAAQAGVRLSDWVRSRALEKGPSKRGPVEQGASEEAGMVPSRASEPYAAPILDGLPKVADVMAEELAKPKFSHGRVCPERGCDWSAPSPNATCPKHNRKIREP